MKMVKMVTVVKVVKVERVINDEGAGGEGGGGEGKVAEGEACEKEVGGCMLVETVAEKTESPLLTRGLLSPGYSCLSAAATKVFKKLTFKENSFHFL